MPKGLGGELGYVESRNLIFEGRYYGSQVERLPTLAAELVAVNVDVIVTGAPPAPEEARRAIAAIPIVMTLHGDPVDSGLVASLAIPGGNVSGLSTVTVDSTGKRLQLLKEAVPGVNRLAVLQDPTFPTAPLELKEVERAARSLKLQTRLRKACDSSEFASVFSAMTQDRAQALVTIGSNTSPIACSARWRHKAENREGVRTGHRALAAAARGRGDPMTRASSRAAMLPYRSDRCDDSDESPFTARRSAARASSRVESSVGSGELASLMISGISVHPSTTASHPSSFRRPMTR